MRDELQSTALVMVLTDDRHAAAVAKHAGWISKVVTRADELVTTHDGETILLPELTIYDRFILAFTDAHSETRDAIAELIGDEHCAWAWVPDDPSEIVETLKTPRPMWADEISTIDDVPEVAPTQTFHVGMPLLDEHGFRITRPSFWPVIGPYGSGKSVLARQIVANVARIHGWRILYTAFEEKIKNRMRDDFRKHFSDSGNAVLSREEMARADELIRRHLLFMRRPRGKVLDCERLLNRIRFAARTYGIQMVVIDPVNEIDHRVPRGVSKTDYMGDFIMGLKQVADDHNLCVMCLAHPPKDATASRNSSGKIYTLNDGADTAHYGNKADIGWCVWRPFREFDNDGEQPPTFLNIDKTKDHDVMGKPTVATLRLQRNGRFAAVKIGRDTYHEIIGQ